MERKVINFVRPLNPAQKKRINEDHKASVRIDASGNLETLSETIITPKGLTKENKKKWVIPDPTERIKKVSEVEYLFSELSHMNIILTNACNLSCTYCYEQHNKDYGRFTEESLLQAYNFLLKYSKKESRAFQFFGGEPMIHKDLILSFLSKNKDYLQQNAHGYTNQLVSMITNGILLTPDFIKEYFSYDFTWMMISLDTLNAEIDHRELKQKEIDAILNSITQIPDEAKSRVVMRCTISRETAPGMEEYIEKVYSLGVKNIIIHPLILDSTAGFIRWEDDEWSKLHKDLVNIINKYHDIKISFSEGVGKKGENNCMIGSDMVAIDASGDFSGCYFFTNQKGGPTNKMILGNLYNENIYIDRYHEFQKNFLQMFEEEEQCKTCNYKDSCYQCPAGNLDTGSKMFRPDDMCQKVVKLYLDLQDDIIRKQYANKFSTMLRRVTDNSEHEVFNQTLLNLMFLMFSGRHVAPDDKGGAMDLTTEQICGAWKHLIQNRLPIDTTSYAKFNDGIPCNCDVKEITIKEFYEFLSKDSNLPTTNSEKVKDLDLQTKVGYLVLLEFLVYNLRMKNLQGALTKEIIGQ
jgi:radical SAM protein with 4Fe4S-binding SPASM domain